jgi:predicted homoserine dehydrogenase-like protein
MKDRSVLPATSSLRLSGLPLRLAHGIKLRRTVKRSQCLSWDDVAVDTSADAYRLRREMEQRLSSTA